MLCRAPTMTAMRSHLAQITWEHIMRIALGAEAHRRYAAIAASEGLPMRLLRTVLTLSPTGAVPMRQLVEQWQCDSSYVTALVDGLEERGLARREASPSDRRAKLVRLTPEGAAVRKRLQELLLIPPSQLLELSDDELRKLAELLAKTTSRLRVCHVGDARAPVIRTDVVQEGRRDRLSGRDNRSAGDKALAGEEDPGPSLRLGNEDALEWTGLRRD